MATFNLKIFSPYGVHFEGEAEAITLRTVTGDVSIWPNHSNTVTALDVGRCSVVINGEKRVGVCNRGLLNVTKNNVEVLEKQIKSECLLIMPTENTFKKIINFIKKFFNY